MTLVKFQFLKPDGKMLDVETESGASVLQVAQEIGLDIEGACEGNMACSTCHIIVDKEHFKALAVASEEEEEMLDLAMGLKATSRLGCQVIVDERLSGAVLAIPKSTRNMLGL